MPLRLLRSFVWPLTSCPQTRNRCCWQTGDSTGADIDIRWFSFGVRLFKSASSTSIPIPNSNLNMVRHPALSHILSSNAQWAKDVEEAQPGFFAESAKGQSPKVGQAPHEFATKFTPSCRFCGLDAPIRGCPSRSSRPLALVTSSSIATSPSAISPSRICERYR
jgi:hypothetical protein